MTPDVSASRLSYLQNLGWSEFFSSQPTAGETGLSQARVDAVHRSRLTALAEAGRMDVVLPTHTDTADYAVGGWLLLDPLSRLLHRRLERRTTLQRPADGKRPAQLVAANVDTLLIVTSCDADFNPARLERYLAFANQSGTQPMIVLTKADAVAKPAEFERQAMALQRDLRVVALNARSADANAQIRKHVYVYQVPRRLNFARPSDHLAVHEPQEISKWIGSHLLRDEGVFPKSNHLAI